MSPYYSTLDYTEQRVVDARQIFKRFDQFFSALNHVIRRAEQLEHVSHRWHAEEHALHQSLVECQHAVRRSLSDNFDTHLAVTALLHLTARAAHYLHATESRGHVVLLVTLVRDYVSRMLTIFGLQGYDHVTVQQGSASRDQHQFTQLLDVLVHARHELRTELVQALKAETRDQSSDQTRALIQRLLPLVDKMRDELLPLGIKLEDSKGSTLIKELRTDPRTEAALQEMRTKSKLRASELKESSTKH